MKSPLIYAHRGASFDFPEMSQAAYEAAIEQGADGFECDLRLTKDLVLICWHDASMKRVADCDLVIANSTYAEIMAAYPVVTLAQLLELAIAHQKNLALETKHPVPTHGKVETELLRILSKYRARITDSGIDVSIMSFSWLAIARLRRSGWNTVYLAAHRWFFLFNVGKSLGPSVGMLHQIRNNPLRHKRKFVWTANTEAEILKCKQYGADVMMTDRPAFARTILQSA